ncbi:MAG: DUF4914 family protein [Phycisphaeraceae bacterium]
MPVATAAIPFNVSPEVQDILQNCKGYTIPASVEELIEASVKDVGPDGWQDVGYDVPGRGFQVEARACRVKNGIAANYTDAYMRRRDPDCMFIGDELATNKQRFKDTFKKEFAEVRGETFEWLKSQELCVFPFVCGDKASGLPALVVAPANAGFFALGLAMLQGMLTPRQTPKTFTPRAVIYVAPPFRHTHFDGGQVVVHNRTKGLHELFSYNLYPGPSAKKGVYGVLISLGEQEGWVTAHCSTVQVITPYDNIVTIMHEGASGGGKSEMLEHVHRESDGRLLLGRNVVDGEEAHLALPRTCELRPVTDDMALCLPSLQGDDKKLSLKDAEDAWFVRVNHIDEYGTDPHLEALTVRPPVPLLFLNIEATPGATTLIWEPIMDEPGKPCPNPRVIVPRHCVPHVVNGPVTVDIRSFGVRTPPCTEAKPTYGILGMLQILPPALAWLWRLVAPRGHGNPSIVGGSGLESEGVGSYWPFATGRRVDQANLLLKQIERTTRTAFVLTPNQHVGSWKTGFMPQWIVREYLSRRGGARFRPEQVAPARCPLLGSVPKQIVVESTHIPVHFLRVEMQPEVGLEAYDKGAQLLTNFFRETLEKYLEPDLLPLGRWIIEAFLNGATVEDYVKLLPPE